MMYLVFEQDGSVLQSIKRSQARALMKASQATKTQHNPPAITLLGGLTISVDAETGDVSVNTKSVDTEEPTSDNLQVGSDQSNAAGEIEGLRTDIHSELAKLLDRIESEARRIDKINSDTFTSPSYPLELGEKLALEVSEMAAIATEDRRQMRHLIEAMQASQRRMSDLLSSVQGKQLSIEKSIQEHKHLADQESVEALVNAQISNRLTTLDTELRDLVSQSRQDLDEIDQAINAYIRRLEESIKTHSHEFEVSTNPNEVLATIRAEVEAAIKESNIQSELHRIDQRVSEHGHYHEHDTTHSHDDITQQANGLSKQLEQLKALQEGITQSLVKQDERIDSFVNLTFNAAPIPESAAPPVEAKTLTFIESEPELRLFGDGAVRAGQQGLTLISTIKKREAGFWSDVVLDRPGDYIEWLSITQSVIGLSANPEILAPDPKHWYKTADYAWYAVTNYARVYKDGKRVNATKYPWNKNSLRLLINGNKRIEWQMKEGDTWTTQYISEDPITRSLFPFGNLLSSNSKVTFIKVGHHKFSTSP